MLKKKKKEVVVDLVDSLFVLLNVFWKYPLPGTLERKKMEVLMWIGNGAR